MMNRQEGQITLFMVSIATVEFGLQEQKMRSRLPSTFCGSLFDILRFSARVGPKLRERLRPN